MSGPVEVARSAWGADAPEWIIRLARECAARSQRQVADEIGRSAALVSQVLRGKYTGDMVAVEDLVRGHFMAGTIECPALGLIRAHECQDWRAKARRAASNNMLRVRMYRACNHCPRNRKGEPNG